MADEVERGTLSQDDYETVSSYTRRVAARANTLFSGDFVRWWDLGRYYRLVTELAFNKRRTAHFPEKKDTRAHVVGLRRQVAMLRYEL